MALVSPGQQITVTDAAQYLPTAVGTVPLVLMATASNKTVNGVLASGTTSANAGKLQVFTSQRDIATGLGYPIFQNTSAGTPLHGNELNEYGLMTAYSALGAGSQCYVIRADIDLAQLAPTTVRPTGSVANGTYWLDLSSTTWGIFQWSAATQTHTAQTPLVITSASQVTNTTQGSLTNEPTPIQSVGQIGSYAVVATTTNNRIFFKAGANLPTTSSLYNTWVLVGTPNWKASNPTMVGSAVSPTLTNGQNMVINGTTVTISGTTLAAAVSAITTAAITGITAGVVNNQLYLYSDGTSKSNGSTVDGKILIGAGTGLAVGCGLTIGTAVNSPALQYSTYASVPSWFTSDATAAPSGSVWLKVGATGGGANLVFRQYNSLTATWSALASSIYDTTTNALLGLDPVAGGSSIGLGALWAKEDPNPNAIPLLGYAGFQPRVRTVYGAVTTTGNVPGSATPFTNANFFTMNVTQPSSAVTTTYTILLAGTGVNDFVAAVLAANIPNVTAQVTSSGAISITHLTGGNIVLDVGAAQQDIPTAAGFVSGVANVLVQGTARVLSGFSTLSYTYSITQPTAAPASGTYWYDSDPTQIDIMINTGTAWSGYRNVSADARGYNLSLTDPTGVICAAVAPTTQVSGNALVAGDLWINTANLEAFPDLRRYNGSSWVAVNVDDQVSQNGTLFADARWDITGTTDPVSGTIVSTASMLTSNYTDLDAPNPLLYPRGMLLFNTRRSGYNVARYVTNYFNTTSFSVPAWAGTTTSYVAGNKVLAGTTIYVCISNVASSGGNSTPPNDSTHWTALQTASWVTASGNNGNDVMYAGHYAQRQIIISALKAAVASNTEIREDQFQFSLITAPGYPEVIPDLVALNNDRANTAFVIGDTPMNLSADVVSLTNWSNDTNGTGLSTADPYLGVYYPSGLTTDLSGNTIMVPPSYMALRVFLHNDNVAYPWMAPAGTRRGLVDNATDIGYLNSTTGQFIRTGVSQGLRDALYQININPFTIMTGTGLVCWGQKTRNPTTSALDRVNVARLVNHIRTVLAHTGNAFLFEPNDTITRSQIKKVIESALVDLVSKRGIYDFLVVCDTSNNTPARMAANELYVDIAIEPMKDAEFIYIPIRLLNPGSIAGGNLGNTSN